MRWDSFPLHFFFVHDVCNSFLFGVSYPARTIVTFSLGPVVPCKEPESLPHDGFMPPTLSLARFAILLLIARVRCRCNQLSR